MTRCVWGACLPSPPQMLTAVTLLLPLPLQPAEANSIAQQALGNIRTVYAFNGDQRTVAAYDAKLDDPVKVLWVLRWDSGVEKRAQARG